MNQEIKTRWIEALRSGKYKQAVGVLHDGDGFCCLGVLCDVLAVPMSYEDELNRWYYGDPGDSDFEGLPISVREEAEIDGVCGNLRIPVTYSNRRFDTLANLNDAQADFNFIADVIEKQL